MFKYYRKLKPKSTEEHEWEEISYEKALDIMLTTWKDNDMTRDMLHTPNWIECRFSQIQVKEIDADGRERVLMPGYANMVPMHHEYDEEGNRIKEEK